MARWVDHAMLKFPAGYTAGSKDQILNALQTSTTVDEFKNKLTDLKNQGVIAENSITPLVMALQNRIQSPSFQIELNRRPGQEHIEVTIPIAKCSHLQLTEGNLGEIFGLANEHTVNTQYACQNTSRMIAGQMVHRPNHNGTHSVRQVRCLEAMFDIIGKNGTPQAQNTLSQLTDAEKTNMKLAAYFLRAGRVDESSHKNPPADDYYTRSATIYEAYARQLGVDEATIDWTKKLIVDSCKPMALCQEANKSEKSMFVYSLFTTIHELDLVRCFDANHIAVNKAGTEKHLSHLVQNSDQNVEKLYNFSKDLCAATGSSRRVDGFKGDSNLFANCSVDGKLCLQQVRTVPMPAWS